MKSLHNHSPQCVLSLLFSLATLLILCLESGGASPMTLPDNVTIPAVFAFGDSIVDPGNNNGLMTTAKCNFPPYGRDFDGGIATGRFSNGRVPSDLIAEAIGVKDKLPAYLDPSLHTDDLLTGVSFASGAAGYDPLSAQLALVMTLSDQLDHFRNYISKIKAEVGDERTTTIVSESVYIVCTGSNDITNTYFAIPTRSSVYDISSYADLLVTSASGFIQELHGMGARRIAVLSLPPTGCLPSQRTLRGGIQRGCFEQGNDAAVIVNSKLSSEILSLDSSLQDAKIVYLDIYNPLLDIIQNPAQYGLSVGNRGCCGTGLLEVSYLCNKDDPRTCPDATKYVFWDSFHPTETTYRLLTSQLLEKYVDKFI